MNYDSMKRLLAVLKGKVLCLLKMKRDLSPQNFGNADNLITANTNSIVIISCGAIESTISPSAVWDKIVP